MLENRIERAHVKGVKKLGGISLKMVSPTMDSLPDRQILLPGGRTVFREFKRPGKEPTKMQKIVIGWFRDLGFDVEFIDTLEKVKKDLEWLARK